MLVYEYVRILSQLDLSHFIVRDALLLLVLAQTISSLFRANEMFFAYRILFFQHFRGGDAAEYYVGRKRGVEGERAREGEEKIKKRTKKRREN